MINGAASGLTLGSWYRADAVMPSGTPDTYRGFTTKSSSTSVRTWMATMR